MKGGPAAGRYLNAITQDPRLGPHLALRSHLPVAPRHGGQHDNVLRQMNLTALLCAVLIGPRTALAFIRANARFGL